MSYPNAEFYPNSFPNPNSIADHGLVELVAVCEGFG